MRGGSSLRGRKRSGASEVGQGKERETGRGASAVAGDIRAFRRVFASRMECRQLSCAAMRYEGVGRESLLLYLQVERKLGGNDTMGHGTK